MSKTEGFLILDTQNVAAGEDKAEKSAGPCPQSIARRKLADISNIPLNPRPLIQDNKSQPIPTTTTAYIEQLQMEKMTLVKMLAQRNKIIEQSGIELERLRLNLIKVQGQNQQLALSHTQMLAELNFGKDRLKALQHELGCKTGLLKAIKSKGGEACKVLCQSADAEVNLIKLPEEVETSAVGRDDEKPPSTKRRLRSQSFSCSEPLQSEENVGNRRPAMRRQSARFTAIEPKSAEDPSDRDRTKYPECFLPDDPVLEGGSSSGSALVKNEDNRSSSEVNLIKLLEEGETSTVGRDDEKPPNTRRRLRSQSFGSSEPLQSEENAGNRRPSVRRQYARFKPVESKSAEDLSHKGGTIFPDCPLPANPVLENGSISEVNLIKLPDKGETSTVGGDDENFRNTKRRLLLQSFGSSEPLHIEENAGDRRFTKPVESKSTEYPIKNDDTKFPEQVLESGSTSESASVKIEYNKSSSGFKYESQENGRSSLCRSSRLAAKKVQSYKEIPLNVKMRRPE